MFLSSSSQSSSPLPSAPANVTSVELWPLLGHRGQGRKALFYTTTYYSTPYLRGWFEGWLLRGKWWEREEKWLFCHVVQARYLYYFVTATNNNCIVVDGGLRQPHVS